MKRQPTPKSDSGRQKKTTARHTARMPRFFEDAASCFLKMIYVDRFRASVGQSTTCGISIFVLFLALCRVVVIDQEEGFDMNLSRDIHSLTDFKQRTPEFVQQL